MFLSFLNRKHKRFQLQFLFSRCKLCLRYTAGNSNENASMRALPKILWARASDHSSNFCEQSEQRPKFASTFKLDGTIQYPFLSLIADSRPSRFTVNVPVISASASNWQVLHLVWCSLQEFSKKVENYSRKSRWFSNHAKVNAYFTDHGKIENSFPRPEKYRFTNQRKNKSSFTLHAKQKWPFVRHEKSIGDPQ